MECKFKKEVKKVKPETTVVIISGNSGLDDALKAVDLGTYHILQKPVQNKGASIFVKNTEYHATNQIVEIKGKQHFSNKGQFYYQNSSILNSVDTALKWLRVILIF